MAIASENRYKRSERSARQQEKRRVRNTEHRALSTSEGPSVNHFDFPSLNAAKIALRLGSCAKGFVKPASVGKRNCPCRDATGPLPDL